MEKSYQGKKISPSRNYRTGGLGRRFSFELWYD